MLNIAKVGSNSCPLGCCVWVHELLNGILKGCEDVAQPAWGKEFLTQTGGCMRDDGFVRWSDGIGGF